MCRENALDTRLLKILVWFFCWFWMTGCRSDLNAFKEIEMDYLNNHGQIFVLWLSSIHPWENWEALFDFDQQQLKTHLEEMSIDLIHGYRESLRLIKQY